ncbi:MAG: NAD+ synthase [Actinomycetota bacterium]|nr:NAD+ synthase [Actinomycetota bacterium]
MSVIRLTLAQVNAKVGDLAANALLVRAAALQAGAAGAHLIALPEQVLTGYPVEDLALRPSFQLAARAALQDLAQDLQADGQGELICVVGYLDRLDFDTQAGPRNAPINAAAVLYRGSVVARYTKHHLPNYGVFDEARYFIPGTQPLLLRLNDSTIAIAICEDLWQSGGPVTWARENAADLLLVVNASPYERNKDDARLKLCQLRAVEAGCDLAYVNLVGGQDELVFDGDSLVVDKSGRLLARAPQFEPTLLTIDLEISTSPKPKTCIELGPITWKDQVSYAPQIAPNLTDPQEVYQALTLGLGDYVKKNGFQSVILGLSGGIDSALVAALACDSIGAEHVFGVSMPSVYSSEHSKDDASDLAQRTGLNLRTIAIAPMVDSYLQAMQLTGLAEENLQSRVRGTTLMALSNQEGHLVLTTGNKSELSVGYSTLYGDSVGGFAPIKDVPKTLVWELARWRNAHAIELGQTPPIPVSSIEKEPSAELRPDQKDSDSLPDYQVLDELLDAYVSADMGATELVAAGFDSSLVDRVLRLTDAAEYKRRQSPPGTKISLRAFGRDRRLPITNGWREPSRSEELRQ